MMTVFFGHFVLGLPAAERFLVLQNKDPETGLYSKAWTDLYFIGFWVIVFTFLRAFVRSFFLKPIAVYAGVKKEHSQNRFQEEGWVCMYYTLSWCMGMVRKRKNKGKRRQGTDGGWDARDSGYHEGQD